VNLAKTQERMNRSNPFTGMPESAGLPLVVYAV